MLYELQNYVLGTDLPLLLGQPLGQLHVHGVQQQGLALYSQI